MTNKTTTPDGENEPKAEEITTTGPDSQAKPLGNEDVNAKRKAKEIEERKERLLEDYIPDFFQNMEVQMGNGVLHGLIGEWINESFPLPSEFKPFNIWIDASRTGTVHVEETTDLFQALYLTWWHDRNVDLKQVFQTFETIDPKLAEVVRVQFRRLFTRRTIQMVVDPKTGKEYPDL